MMRARGPPAQDLSRREGENSDEVSPAELGFTHQATRHMRAPNKRRALTLPPYFPPRASNERTRHQAISSSSTHSDRGNFPEGGTTFGKDGGQRLRRSSLRRGQATKTLCPKKWLLRSPVVQTVSDDSSTTKHTKPRAPGSPRTRSDTSNRHALASRHSCPTAVSRAGCRGALRLLAGPISSSAECLC